MTLKTKNVSGTNPGGKTELIWMLRSVRTRIPALLVMLAGYVGASLLAVAFALGSSRVVDTAIAGDKAEFIDACVLQATIIIGIILCLTVYRHLKDRLMADLDRDWKKRLLHQLLHGDYASVTKFHSAELINRMNNDVRILDDGLVSMLPNVAGMATTLIAAMGALIVLDPLFAVALMGVGVLLVIITGILRNRLKGLNKRVSEHEGKVLGFLQEALENLLAVQAMDVSDEMEKRADVLLEGRYQVQRRRKNVTLFANTSISTLSYLATFITLVWCSAKLMDGAITFGTLTAMIQLVGQLRGPLVNMSGIMPRYAAMTAASERLREIEALQDGISVDSDSEAAENMQDFEVHSIYESMISLGGSGMHFAYSEDEQPVFTEASFKIPKGGFAAIAGSSGIGKSTLLKLILGIFKLNAGELYVECSKVCSDNMHKSETFRIPLGRATRRLFAYVPQNNLLFSGTLRENLVIANPDASETEIEHAVYVSCMDEYISQMPDGLETVIGEDAAGLSEGQAQRLAIARAVLGGAPVLLLDESTSALDPALEKELLDRIRKLPDRMCIAVTHRPAALEVCDIQIDMSDGKVKTIKVEKGQ